MARGDENGGNSGDGAQPKRDRIAALDEQIRQLQARRDGLKAAAAAKERKRDTRRKILLGSQLVKLARDGDDQARALIARAVEAMPEHSRAVFEGWEP